MKILDRALMRRDDGVAMLSVLMLMMVLTVLAILVLGAVLTQVNPTLFSDKNSRTLAAAQAGLDVTAAQVRNATAPDGTGAIMGDIHRLPCIVEGTVDNSGDTTYRATVEYYKDDPTTRDETWRAANQLRCYTGTGLNGGVRDVPRFAVIESEGFDVTATAQVDRADRVVEATYQFQLTTMKVSGGQIYDDDLQYCLVADHAGEGANIRYRPAGHSDCNEKTALNSWTWDEDYMLHLASSDLPGVIPMCISGRPWSNGSARAVTLQECALGTRDDLGQRFSWTGSHTWRGQNSANTAYADSYLVNQDSRVDANDALSAANSATNKSVTPEPAVGKGNASYATNQVVNFHEFGRCLDVTDEDINKSYMIAYPCKQDPSGFGSFKWNHKWFYAEPTDTESVTTTIHVLVDNRTDRKYCLYTPSGSVYPRFGTTCTGDSRTWTRYGQTGDEDAYTIQDSAGRCLTVGGSEYPLHGSQWSRIVVATCEGKETQQWNVPTDPVDATLGEFSELTGRAG
ncbi:hypothetical protein [Demequina sp. NBRC 110056]|uniref:hypothetical protein n=1 Tax=Demequina sp. NBRC 110056 TaxID=1570345 RepID=UPI0009FDB013|nr:hypothetical protein [Demequina sp. NBRC 110056]